MSENIQLKMSLPKIPDIELVLVEGLERMAKHLGISDDKIGEGRILVTEAVINALEHSGQKQPTVDVEFTMTRKNWQYLSVIMAKDLNRKKLKILTSIKSSVQRVSVDGDLN